MRLSQTTELVQEVGKVVVSTTYDIEPALRQAEADRQAGGVVIGSKGQQLLKACVFPADHITKVKEESGYDLLSPDPDQWRKALLYIQTHHQRLMSTDKKVFTGREAKKWV